MMLGQLALEDMRRGGHAPKYVFLNTDQATYCGRLSVYRHWHHWSPLAAQLHLSGSVPPSMADLRCLVGLRVIVSGVEAKIVHSTASRCKAAGAARVIANLLRLEYRDAGTGDFRHVCVAITDTDNVLTWEACDGSDSG